YTIWSVEYQCPNCKCAFRLWDAPLDQNTGQVASRFPCPECRTELSKGRLKRLGSVPVLLSIQLPDGRRLERQPNAEELAHIQRIDLEPIDDWYPTVPFSADREMYIRSALHLQRVSHVSDFYTRRNLRALSLLWREV